MSEEQIIQAIVSLRYSDPSESLEHVFIPKSDYGKAEVYRMYDTYILFGIPEYGGTPYFCNSYHLSAITNLIEDIKKM